MSKRLDHSIIKKSSLKKFENIITIPTINDLSPKDIQLISNELENLEFLILQYIAENDTGNLFEASRYSFEILNFLDLPNDHSEKLIKGCYAICYAILGGEEKYIISNYILKNIIQVISIEKMDWDDYLLYHIIISILHIHNKNYQKTLNIIEVLTEEQKNKEKLLLEKIVNPMNKNFIIHKLVFLYNIITSIEIIATSKLGKISPIKFLDQINNAENNIYKSNNTQLKSLIPVLKYTLTKLYSDDEKNNDEKNDFIKQLKVNRSVLNSIREKFSKYRLSINEKKISNIKRMMITTNIIVSIVSIVFFGIIPIIIYDLIADFPNSLLISSLPFILIPFIIFVIYKIITKQSENEKY